MMDAEPTQSRDFSPLEALEGAFDWWREAGVDHAYDDEASGWLREPEAPDAVAAPPPPAPPREVVKTPLQRALARGPAPEVGGPEGSWPDSLEKFRGWWMTEATLADGALDRRVPPRGVEGARLMVLVGQPEEDDAEGLLSGGAGRLLAAMLRAMAIEDHETYRASILPAPLAMPEWDALGARGFGALTRHHIALARPQRVLAFGRAQMALFGVDPAQARDPLALDCGGTAIPLLAAPDLAQLARSAARRRNFWQRWLDWTA